MSKKIKTILSISILIATIGISLGIGYWFGYKNNYQHTKDLITHILPIRENNFNYKFIYPLLRYDFGNARYFLEDKTLEQKINDYVQQQYKLQNAENISVYFSSFDNGQWAGVNADTQYHPGSMMKVLIMMAYYRESQLDLSVMQKSFMYTKDFDQLLRNPSNFDSLSNLIVGQSYTTRYLIEDMIANSDNGAELVLYQNVDKNILNDVYRDLKIPVPDGTPNYTISAKDYSAFLRILYSSTYLSEINSEDALSVMSKSTFRDGLVVGVPSEVIVAHKYGEAVDTDPTTNEVTGTELHDCGVVYYNSYPYTLCIMTKANGAVDQKQLTSIIKDISGLVYNYVSVSHSRSN